MSLIQKFIGPDQISNEIVFEIDTINKCNFNCTYCEMQKNGWNPNNNRIDWGKTQNILDLIPFFNKFPYPYKIHLLGGEPTLHKDLISFLQFIDNNDNKKIKIFSNGSNFKKISKISKLNKKHIDLTISIHLDEFTDEHLNKYLINELNGFKNIKFLIILYNLEKYKERIEYLISTLINYFPVEWYPAFDENGYYKLNEKEFQIWEELDNKFQNNNIKLNLIKISHRELYINRLKFSQIKTCYKNLWLIDYKHEFHLDGTNFKINLNQITDYNIFKFKTIECTKECWCPANNYYTKIRK